MGQTNEVDLSVNKPQYDACVQDDMLDIYINVLAQQGFKVVKIVITKEDEEAGYGGDWYELVPVSDPRPASRFK